jgi:ABC-2 type transport system ATP-binding protein
MVTEDTSVGAPVVVSVENLSKRFILRKDNSIKERVVTLGRAGRRHMVDFWALDEVTLEIRAGSTVGLIGHNGSGKSTLLKALGGIIEPTKGVVRQRGRLASLLELGAGFHPDLTGRENVYLNASLLGMSRAETTSRFDEIVAFSGIEDFIDTQVKFYSSGMYVRLAFAVAIHTDPDVLLIDEVLAVGDEAFQRKCLDRIRLFQSQGRTIVLVSHSMGQILDFCDRAILLDHGKVELDGLPKDVVRRFRELLEEERVSLMSQDERRSRGSLRILDANAQAPGEELQAGGTINLDIDILSETRLDDWVIGIQIDNVHGQAVYSTTTTRMGAQLAPFAGKVRARVALEAAHFGGGRYFVNISLMSSRGVHLVDLPGACTFVAVDRPQFVGSAVADPRVSVS